MADGRAVGGLVLPAVRRSPASAAPLPFRGGGGLPERIRPRGTPLLYEDEGSEMGESSLHTETCDILLYGLEFHLASRAGHRVFGNLNLHYSAEDPAAYVSPDVMVVRPSRRLPKRLRSYRVGKEGPAPVFVAEVLSWRTFQEGDLTAKPVVYASLGVPEYVLVDVSGEYLAQKLLLLRRQRAGSWADEQDPDGGVTSRLGFRVVLDADGQVRVVDGKTGKRYARPGEAQAAADGWAAEAAARQELEGRLRDLEAELARLRGKAGQRRKKP